MSLELAVGTDLVATTGDLPTIAELERRVLALVGEGEAGLLDEARRRAEAYSLYEERAGHEERAHHFSCLRFLAEAGIGVISFDNPDVIEKATQRSNWRLLGAALERGRLIRVLNETRARSESEVVRQLRYSGHGSVPGEPFGRNGSIPWKDARIFARDHGIDPTELPLDAAVVRRRSAAAVQQSLRMRRMYQAQERLTRMKRQKVLAARTKQVGPKIDAAYLLHRRTLQAVFDCQAEVKELPSEEQREAYDDLFYHLHAAEDAFAKIGGIA